MNKVQPLVQPKRRLLIIIGLVLIVAIAVGWWLIKGRTKTTEETLAPLIADSQKFFEEKDKQAKVNANRINVIKEEVDNPDLTNDQKYALYFEGAFILAQKKDDEAKKYATLALTFYPADPAFQSRNKVIHDKLVEISKGNYDVVPQ